MYIRYSDHFCWFRFRSVVGAHVENATIDMDRTEGEVSRKLVINFNIHLKRLPAYYLFNIIIIVVVLAFLSSFMFYIPVDSGENCLWWLRYCCHFQCFCWYFPTKLYRCHKIYLSWVWFIQKLYLLLLSFYFVIKLECIYRNKNMKTFDLSLIVPLRANFRQKMIWYS